jgi:plasmid stability protein
MPNVQIRDVPPDVHDVLKQRAAKNGQSLSQYLLAELTALADQPTLEELVERIERRGRVRLEPGAAETIRTEREERDRRLAGR